MTDPIQLPGIELQRQLSDFLYAESLHTLGSYQMACEKLEALRAELGGSDAARGLNAAAAKAYRCNDHLRNGLHRPLGTEPAGADLGRHPSPFPPPPKLARPFVRRPRLPKHGLLDGITSFYGDAEAALALHLRDPALAKEKNAPAGNLLGSKLAFVHDPQRRPQLEEPESARLIEGKIARTQARLKALEEFRPRIPTPSRPRRGHDAGFARTLGAHAGGNHTLLLTILDALTEAHMWMHQAEHLYAQSFGPKFSSIPDTHAKTQRMLRYSVALNTFVFVVARAVPWIFAEDERERDHVITHYEECCEKLAPTYCMWISAQLSLLALHRRAFSWWTMGKLDRAYRDFHKLTRLLRGLRKPSEKRGLRVPGTKTFIEGMTGMSELHIGRIYRGQHAHRMALRYFDRSSRHLKGWESHAEIGPVIKNSAWRINLLLNQGKANYELGHVKRSVLYYARAWRAFLLLVESETHATANVDIVMKFIEWLAPVVDEPELSRQELRDRVEPLVEQFVTLRSPIHLRLLGAEIVLRMGHLLFIFRLPPGEDEEGQKEADHDLAFACIGQAARLNPTSTVAAADLLRIQHETGRLPDRDDEHVEVPLPAHWPPGGGRFEEAARITEYALQKALVPTRAADKGGDIEERAKVARALLGAFLAHTDSSNVKLAQVYRYLMQEPRAMKRKTDGGEYTLDFVCLRRYASFFPFLPRPAAFRAPGGGYFVHLREAGEDQEPFGIAVDPGPDFIENLYRCGYGLADIHMIVVTHDHADHIASVDAVLALMGIRMGLGDDRFDRKEGRRLVIVGNESVCRRYEFFDNTHPVETETVTEKDGSTVKRPAQRRDAVRVIGFEEIAEITDPRPGRSERIRKKEIVLEPRTLRIEPVRSWGHTDAHGYVSQAFLLSFGPSGERCSVLFTGDTGVPPEREDEKWEEKAHLLAPGTKGLWEAVEEADLVVAHLSSVPLRELRHLAALDYDADAETAIAEYRKIWSDAARQARRRSNNEDTRNGVRETKFLLNQIQFGFRTRPKHRDEDFDVSPFSDTADIKDQPEKHLYLTGLIELAKRMEKSDRSPLLLVGELREELGTFRTRIAYRIARAFFRTGPGSPSALTADIGLRVRLSRPARGGTAPVSVLCTTCDLDNDLMPAERFHLPEDIKEVCVKGEDEGVFYNCGFHNPRLTEGDLWIEAVERYDIFGE